MRVRSTVLLFTIVLILGTAPLPATQQGSGFLSPLPGYLHFSGYPVTIKWSRSRLDSQTVEIAVFRALIQKPWSDFTTSRYGPFANDGSQSVSIHIPRDSRGGVGGCGNYYIYVYSKQTRQEVHSRGIQMVYKALEPRANQILYIGNHRAYTIRWGPPIEDRMPELWLVSPSGARTKRICRSNFPCNVHYDQFNPTVYHWVLPQYECSPGTYRVKVIGYSPRQDVYALSEPFKVMKQRTFMSAAPVITRPQGGETLSRRSRYEIQWRGIQNYPVRIELSDNGGSVFNRRITSSTSSREHYVWNISAGLAPGSRYVMRIVSIGTPSEKILSGIFRIQ